MSTTATKTKTKGKKNTAENARSADERRAEVIEQLVEAIAGGEMPWEKGWLVTGGRPQNPISNTIYRGENALWLWLASIRRNLPDHRWCTFDQAVKNGWSVRGAKHEPVFFASKRVKLAKAIKKRIWWDPTALARELGTTALPEGAEIRFTTRYSRVFNYSEIEGAPEREDVLKGREDHDLATMGLTPEWFEAITAEIPLKRGGDRAYYSTKADDVTLPLSKAFTDPDAEASVFFHEYAHGSGHQSRLARKSLGAMYHVDDAVRGYEELVAESAAALVMAELGRPYRSTHGAYIQSWAKALRAGNVNERIEEARKAFREGGHAANWILEFRTES